MTAVFDGRSATEHAEAATDAVRAINHITSWPAGLDDPSEAYTVLGHLAAVAAMLPQAFVQISRQVTAWHDAGLIGIDPGTRYHGFTGEAVADLHAALTVAADAACALYGALTHATNVLAHAHHLDPDRDTDADRERGVGA
jgi:hypothetical protein